MEQPAAASPLIPLLIMSIPIIIFNVFLARRKGKSLLLYGILSVLPPIGFFLAVYLASLTDKSISKKIDKIINLLETR